MLQCQQTLVHLPFQFVRCLFVTFYIPFQRVIFVNDLPKRIFQESVFLRIVRRRVLFYPVQVCLFPTMFRQFIFDGRRHTLYPVRPLVGLISAEPSARTFDDALASLDELLPFTRKHIPPYQFRRLALCVGCESVKRASHIVERKHAVFPFDVLYYLVPMLVVVQFGAQHFVSEGESPCLTPHLIDKVQFTLSDVVSIIDESGQHTTSEREAFIVAL